MRMVRGAHEFLSTHLSVHVLKDQARLRMERGDHEMLQKVSWAVIRTVSQIILVQLFVCTRAAIPTSRLQLWNVSIA